ncbi:hypothetical protein INT47_012671 [Mucor saturninus]|uniref:Uncharacterized protein n=1 Tax=Mucor saturninus TaxID=64648 RepID=A0A8H7QRI7_9FUNG|nr:hypothetical protein INT47_012671 [Mucor saturninus]
MTSIARTNLLNHQDEDESYFSSDKPSYYSRSNLQSPSFRQKCKGFRSRSSSYTSLDDKHQYNGSMNNYDASSSPSTSLFSRKRLGMTSERSSTSPSTYFSTNKQEEYDDDTSSDESTFFAKKSNYSRQNLGSRSSSWKTCVLRAVGVKSAK